MFSFKPKPWDSDFFGIRIAESHSKAVNVLELSKGLTKIRKAGFKACYWFVNKTDAVSIRAAKRLKLKRVDDKVTFEKELGPGAAGKAPSGITVLSQNAPMDDALMDLALSAGAFSRFKTDTRFPRGSFEKLYREWLVASVRRRLADEVFVTLYNNIITGFVTVTVKAKTAKIGLIAVSKKHTKEGVGSQLLAFTENWALANGARNMQVVTQGQNITAMKFYAKNNYVVVRTASVFHLWPPKDVNG